MMGEQTFLDDFGFEHTYAPGKCLCGLTHAGDLISPVLSEQAEPAVWQWKFKDGTVWWDCSEKAAEEQARGPRTESRALYTHPPASSKEADGCEGLREALEKIAAGKEMATIIARNALAAQEQK